MLKLDTIPYKRARIAWRVIAGEAVIVLPVAGCVLALNESGTRVWKAIDGRRTVGKIADGLVREYDVPEPRARRDVRKFLKDLVKTKAVLVK